MNENIKVIELKKNNIIINSLKRALKNSFQKEHIDPEYIDINLYDKIYICYSGGRSSIRKKTFTPTTILGFALITDITKYRNSSTHFIDLITNINQVNKKIGLLLLNTLEKNCKNVELVALPYVVNYYLKQGFYIKNILLKETIPFKNIHFSNDNEVFELIKNNEKYKQFYTKILQNNSAKNKTEYKETYTNQEITDIIFNGIEMIKHL